LKKHFNTEAELCDAFIHFVNKNGWTVYPEQNGWDMLLVKNDIQIGIQAKIRPNIDVLYQTLPPYIIMPVNGTETKKGPNFRAVLTQGVYVEFRTICRSLRIIAISPRHIRADGTIEDWDGGWLIEENLNEAYRWKPMKQEWLPDIVPMHKCGVASPTTLSKWSQSALKAFAYLEENKTITSKKIKEYGINSQLLVQLKYIKPTIDKDGRHTLYIKGECLEKFILKHEKEYEKFWQMEKDKTIEKETNKDIIIGK